MSYFKRKDFELTKEVISSSKLQKTLSGFDLILFGIGGIIGTGVFVLTGSVAAQYAGPAVTISYIIAGLTCIFVALCYTELATMLPTSGSVYTYSYVAFGECVAWVMGSIIIIELCFTAAAVAVGWSGYIQSIIKLAGFVIPSALVNVPVDGGIVNLPAVMIVAFVGLVLYLGSKDSKMINAVLVCIKILAIFIFVLFAVPHFDISNWHEFMPFGFDNVVVGASILFFAFTGFSTIAAAAEECKNPKRDLTVGIVGSLTFATIVYVIIGALVTGIVRFSELNNAEPLAYALSINHSYIGSALVATGAVCGMTTVIMMNIYGISRIFYCIARDGLLPIALARLHHKYNSPYIAIIIFSTVTALLAAFCPLDILGKLSSMGALIDYVVIIFIVIFFRFTLPKIHREFRCPAIFITAPTALIACCYLLLQLLYQNGNLLITGKLAIGWICIMFILYVVFIKTHNEREQPIK